jgi:hypothetical protein
LDPTFGVFVVVLILCVCAQEAFAAFATKRKDSLSQRQFLRWAAHSTAMDFVLQELCSIHGLFSTRSFSALELPQATAELLESEGVSDADFKEHGWGLLGALVGHKSPLVSPNQSPRHSMDEMEIPPTPDLACFHADLSDVQQASMALRLQFQAFMESARGHESRHVCMYLVRRARRGSLVLCVMSNHGTIDLSQFRILYEAEEGYSLLNAPAAVDRRTFALLDDLVRGVTLLNHENCVILPVTARQGRLPPSYLDNIEEVVARFSDGGSLGSSSGTLPDADEDTRSEPTYKNSSPVVDVKRSNRAAADSPTMRRMVLGKSEPNLHAIAPPLASHATAGNLDTYATIESLERARERGATASESHIWDAAEMSDSEIDQARLRLRHFRGQHPESDDDDAAGDV